MGRKKSEENIVEKESIVINEKDIIKDGISDNEIIDVQTTNVIIEKDNNLEDKKDVENNIEESKELDNNLDDEKDVEADEEESKTELVDLEIIISFRDKYTKQNYEAGNKIPFEKSRAYELLADKRKLVKLASK